jgi:hypothetical protein
MRDGYYTEYTLTRNVFEDHDRVRENVHTFRSEDDLAEVLEHMTYFLNGCSFQYIENLEAIKGE